MPIWNRSIKQVDCGIYGNKFVYLLSLSVYNWDCEPKITSDAKIKPNAVLFMCRTDLQIKI
jgi:hypothetical protein